MTKKHINIGLTYTGSEQKHEYCVKWLMDTGEDAIRIVTLKAGSSVVSELEACDGLVLSGGIDIHPSLYGGKEGYAHQPGKFNIERDHFEAALFEKANALQLPVLGVCRGMQLINCLLGGSLHRDIGADKNKIHKIEQVADKEHPVNITKSSLLADIVQAGRVIVNSAHHQAADRLGAGLRVSCSSDDETVEALEWMDSNDKPFLLGIQWHPERMFQWQLHNTGASKGIRDRFVQELIKKGE